MRQIGEWVLINWKDCGFSKEVSVRKVGGFENLFITTAIDGQTSFGSAPYLKDKIRSENSVRGKTPRFRWSAVYERNKI